MPQNSWTTSSLIPLIDVGEKHHHRCICQCCEPLLSSFIRCFFSCRFTVCNYVAFFCAVFVTFARYVSHKKKRTCCEAFMKTAMMSTFMSSNGNSKYLLAYCPKYGGFFLSASPSLSKFVNRYRTIGKWVHQEKRLWHLTNQSFHVTFISYYLRVFERSLSHL